MGHSESSGWHGIAAVGILLGLALLGAVVHDAFWGRGDVQDYGKQHCFQEFDTAECYDDGPVERY